MSQRQALNDDFTNTSLSGFAAAPIVKGGSWGSHLSNIRRDNIFIDRVERVTEWNEETANHWRGIARFFVDTITLLLPQSIRMYLIMITN